MPPQMPLSKQKLILLLFLVKLIKFLLIVCFIITIAVTVGLFVFVKSQCEFGSTCFHLKSIYLIAAV